MLTAGARVQAVEAVVASLSHDADCDAVAEIERAVSCLDLNAPYSERAEAGGDEEMTAGHKLSLDLVHLPHTPAAAKLLGVKTMLEHGLDTNARWREGRASGVVGATLLASVLWLQGVPDDDKLDLARLLIGRGLPVNAESVERSTRASVGTFILAGAINCPALQSHSKAQLLSMIVVTGLDVNAACQQGKDPSTTGSTLGARIAAAAGMKPNDQVAMLTTLVRAGWCPASLSKRDADKLGNVATLMRHPALEPAALSELQQEISKCEAGEWWWAKGKPGQGSGGAVVGAS